MNSISIRLWKQEDAKALYELCRNGELRPYWPHHLPYPYTLEKAIICVNFFIQANPLRYAICAICENQVVCGYIQCFVTGYDCAELSYWLHKAYRQKGIMKYAVSKMCKYAFQCLPIQTIYAHVPMQYIASQTVLLQNHFIESKETAPIYLYFYHHTSFT